MSVIELNSAACSLVYQYLFVQSWVFHICVFCYNFFMFKLTSLPFDVEAFKGALSVESFDFHFGKHHKAYVDNLNNLVADATVCSKYGVSENDSNLLHVIKLAHSFSLNADDSIPALDRKIFNNAAQHWNHTFFWNSITPYKLDVSPALIKLIEKSFGSLQKFSEAFYQAGSQLFGSGWVWLVYNKNIQALEILCTLNAQTPLVEGHLVSLLVCDVWEHAYYIDYRNRRVDYLSYIINQLNWQWADANLNAAIE